MYPVRPSTVMEPEPQRLPRSTLHGAWFHVAKDHAGRQKTHSPKPAVSSRWTALPRKRRAARGSRKRRYCTQATWDEGNRLRGRQRRRTSTARANSTFPLSLLNARYTSPGSSMHRWTSYCAELKVFTMKRQSMRNSLPPRVRHHKALDKGAAMRAETRTALEPLREWHGRGKPPHHPEAAETASLPVDTLVVVLRPVQATAMAW